MGLKEKQAIQQIQDQDIPRFEDRIKEGGLAVALTVDWDSIPPELDTISRVKTVLGHFAVLLWDFGQDKIAKAELGARVRSVVLRHDPALASEYAYALDVKNGTMTFAANFPIVTIAASGSSQKSLRDAIGDLL